ncbi:MAG TPA: lysophospholipid acyltransferase family protein [Chthoniobacteraceae bacterium]|jgi:1-acyl-sn-glycerol-3-phosphate acyltransferase|nr:lysophospholipid acyltransferase family protein [Chthoniobacteraceae bacterium]
MSTTTFPLPAGHHAGGDALPRGWRACSRLLGFFALCLFEVAEWITVVWVPGHSQCHQARAAWLSRFCRRLVALFGIEAVYRGRPPATGLLVCNHLSYLDVIVLAARAPLTFVAKSDIRGWPGLGPLFCCAGTLFVNRERRGDVARTGAEMKAALAGGTSLCVFAEGTSSDGTRVLPFRSSLLAPAVEHGCPVTPAWIGYELEEGSAAEEVCYWGDMTFGPHLLNLLGHRRIRARVCYGAPEEAAGDRKALAARLHAEVCRLGEVDPTWP